HLRDRRYPSLEQTRRNAESARLADARRSVFAWLFFVGVDVGCRRARARIDEPAGHRDLLVFRRAVRAAGLLLADAHGHGRRRLGEMARLLADCFAAVLVALCDRSATVERLRAVDHSTVCAYRRHHTA